MQIGRTSCTRFWASQLRVLLTEISRVETRLSICERRREEVRMGTGVDSRRPMPDHLTLTRNSTVKLGAGEPPFAKVPVVLILTLVTLPS